MTHPIGPSGKIIFRCIFLFYLFNQTSCVNHELQPTCISCSKGKLSSEFDKKFLRLILGRTNDGTETASFFQNDTLNQITTEFLVCSKDEIIFLETRQIIKAKGKVYNACEQGGRDLIEVDSYQIVNYCFAAPTIINSQFDLYNKWLVYSISTPDTLLYVPCEAYPERPYISVDQDLMIHGQSGVNSFVVHFNFDGIDQIILKNGAVGAFVGTTAENNFELTFWKLFALNTSLKYSIGNNILTMENPSNNFKIKLFTL